MLTCPFLPYGIEPMIIYPQPGIRKMYRNRPNYISKPYDPRKIKPPMESVDKFDQKKSLKNRASPLVLLDEKKDSVTITDDKFLIRLNIDCYNPEELSVKTTKEFILIEGHHEAMSPDCQVSRSFSKKWAIPDRVQVDQIESSINWNTGDLVVEAPRASPELVKNLNKMRINDGNRPKKVHFNLAKEDFKTRKIRNVCI